MRPAAPRVNPEAKRAELTGLGLSPEQADAYMEQLAGRSPAPESGVTLWDDDAVAAVEIFCRCQQTTIAGAQGLIFLGVSALEAEAAARACGLPLTAGMLDDVGAIARGAANVLNNRQGAP